MARPTGPVVHPMKPKRTLDCDSEAIIRRLEASLEREAGKDEEPSRWYARGVVIGLNLAINDVLFEREFADSIAEKE